MSDTVEILETPEKSIVDKNSYRAIRLSNGVKALLISEPNTQSKDPVLNEITKNEPSLDEKEQKLSAIGVCMDVGSFCDPRDIQGMSHFLGRFNNQS